jgi:hypothetical protein
LQQEIGDQLRYKYKEVSWRLKEMTEQVGVLEEARLKDLETVLNKKAALQELTNKEVQDCYMSSLLMTYIFLDMQSGGGT